MFPNPHTGVVWFYTASIVHQIPFLVYFMTRITIAPTLYIPGLTLALSHCWPAKNVWMSLQWYLYNDSMILIHVGNVALTCQFYSVSLIKMDYASATSASYPELAKTHLHLHFLRRWRFRTFSPNLLCPTIDSQTFRHYAFTIWNCFPQSLQFIPSLSIFESLPLQLCLWSLLCFGTSAWSKRCNTNLICCCSLALYL